MSAAPLVVCRRQLAIAVFLGAALVAEAEDAITETKDTLILVVSSLVLLAVVFLVVKFHTRFVLFFTGHERVHISFNQLCWLICCRCGGTCDGEWTRFFTSRLCCWNPPLQGVNLKRYFGQQMGIVPIPVRMGNIIVGDLPCAGRSSFYVEVSAGDHPPQTTSVLEEQNPKAVQFEDTLIFHTRDSPAERKVRIAVKELNVLGFRTLCDCYISSKSVLRWKKGDATGPRRVCMTPADRQGNPSMFPPWILIDFTPKPEWNNRTGGFGVSVSTQGNMSDPSEFQNASDFKDEFPLYDPRGAPAEEPKEGQVGRLDDLKRCRLSFVRTCCLLLWLPLISFMFCHFGAFVCYDEFFKMQIFTQHNQSFPVPRDMRELITDECALELTGNEGFRYARHVLLLGYTRARAAAHATSEGLDSVADAALDDLDDHLQSATTRRRRAPAGPAPAKPPTTAPASSSTTTPAEPADAGELVDDDAGELVDERGAGTESAAAGARGAGSPRAPRSAPRGAAPPPAGVDFLTSPARRGAGAERRRLGSGHGENPCRPTMNQVLEGSCAELPERAPPPLLFEDALLGLVQCPRGACSTTRFLDKVSAWVSTYVVVWMLCYWLVASAFDRLIDIQEDEVNSNLDSDNSWRSAANSNDGPGGRGGFEPGYVRLPTQEYRNAEPEVASRQSGGSPWRWSPAF